MLVFLSPATATTKYKLDLCTAPLGAPRGSVQVLDGALRNGKIVVNATARRFKNSILILPPEKDEIDDSLIIVAESCELVASDDAIVHINTNGFSMVELRCGSDVALKWRIGGEWRVHTVRWSCRRNIWVDEHRFPRWTRRRDPVPAPLPLSEVPEMDLKGKVWIPHGEVDAALEPELAEYIEGALERETTEVAEA